MAAYKIFSVPGFILILVLAICQQVNAQSKNTICTTVLSALLTFENKPVSIDKKEDAIYIIATERSCLKCFEDICIYNSKKKYPIYIIVFMEKNLLKMLTKRSRYAEISSCVKDVFFFWTDQNSLEEIATANREPSPQLIIKENKKYIYYNYSEFIKLVY